MPPEISQLGAAKLLVNLERAQLGMFRMYVRTNIHKVHWKNQFLVVVIVPSISIRNNTSNGIHLNHPTVKKMH